MTTGRVSAAAGMEERRPVRRYANLLRGMRPAGARLLHVDCGTGDLLRHLGTWFDAHGFDRRPGARMSCRMNAPEAVVLEDLDAAADGTFDIVVRIGAFSERAADAEIRRLSPKLQEGGVFVMIAPNPGGWAHRLKGVSWFSSHGAQGMGLLTEGQWKMAFRRAGMRVVDVQADGLWGAPYIAGVPEMVQRAVCDVPLYVLDRLPLRRSLLPSAFGECLVLAAQIDDAERRG